MTLASNCSVLTLGIWGNNFSFALAPSFLEATFEAAFATCNTRTFRVARPSFAKRLCS